MHKEMKASICLMVASYSALITIRIEGCNGCNYSPSFSKINILTNKTKNAFEDDTVFLLYSGYPLIRDPQYNKGLAFNEKERDAHFLRGLLPPVVISQDLQVDIILLPIL